MTKPRETLTLSMPSDREIAMARVFDAPRELVFEAYSKPEYLKRWMGVANGWKMVACEVDLRVGGTSRFLWRGPAGEEMGMRGVYREVVVPERIVMAESFDQAWYEGEAVGTVTFVEHAGKTTLTITVRYASKEVRDMVLKTPMKEGMSAGFDMLADVLPTLLKKGG